MSLFLILLAAYFATIPSVRAQTTNITDVSFPKHVAFDLESRTTDPPLVVEMTVSYSDAKPGYFLAVAVFDLYSGDAVSGIGTARGACDSTYALCVINIGPSPGEEDVQFLLAGYRPTMSMAIVAILYDEGKNLIYDSESDYEFTVTMTAALALRVKVPASVSVTVDGIMQPEGSVFLELVPGTHTIEVPEIVALDNVTRLKFKHWSDGVNQTHRSLALGHRTLLSAEYVTQYWLNATTSHGNSTGSGWYDEGSKGSYSIQSEVVPMENLLGVFGGRWVFEGWYERGELVTRSGNGTVTMHSAHSIIARWAPDYTLPVVLFGGLAGVLIMILLIRRRRFVVRKTRRRRKRGPLSTKRGPFSSHRRPSGTRRLRKT